MTRSTNVTAAAALSEMSLKGILSGLALKSPGAAMASTVCPATATVPTVEFGPKCMIFLEGTPASSLYEVVEGVVLLYKMLMDGRRQVMGFVHPGEMFGLSGRGTYPCSAQATGTVRLIAVSRTRFESLRRSQPSLERRLLAIMGEDLQRAQDHLVLLGRKSACEKLCSFLVDVANRSARTGKPTDVIRLPAMRADIADFLGLTVETISRALAQLKAAKIVRLRSTEEVEVLDWDTLTDYAECERSALAA